MIVESKTDAEVNDATAKLKGMLGIGDGSDLPPAPTPAKASNRERPSSRKKRRNQKDKKKKKDKPPENFAWSAFQSSPDASKLPIPAFASPTATPETGKVISNLNTDALSALLGASGSPEKDDLANAPRAEDLEDQFIAEAKKKAAAEKEEKKEKDDSRQPTDEKPSDAPVSKTGVNLAELAACPPATKAETSDSPPKTPEPPKHNPRTPPMQQPHYPYPSYGHNHPYPPPPPPGYMTIQVQVPPALLPGRQMMVTSPSGYPVRVMVPEGIPPGMVIPVHVPAAMPMHMMPPPYPGGSYNYPQNPGR